MKKFFLVFGLLFAVVFGAFAVDESTAKSVIESFLIDKNANIVKLVVTYNSVTGNIYSRASEISGIVIADGDMEISYSQNLLKSEMASYFDHFSLSAINEISYNPKNGVLTIIVKKD